jgi:hypothetical protein
MLPNGSSIGRILALDLIDKAGVFVTVQPTLQTLPFIRELSLCRPQRTTVCHQLNGFRLAVLLSKWRWK